MTPHTPSDHAAEAVRILEAEALALAQVAEGLDRQKFALAVELLLQARAHVIVSGMGKSGHIAAKVAATLASTGTPAFYLHPGEAVHGDLGMLTRDNALVAFSHSGATDEVLNLLPYARQLHIPVIAITGNGASPLAERAAVALVYRIEAEACPLNLAPTTSTTVQLAMGDAIAGALIRAHGFQPEDFAIRHPLGSLGRRLQMRVGDVMARGAELPVLAETESLEAALHAMTRGRLGCVAFVDGAGRLSGIFTDGDLRRLIGREGGLDLARPSHAIMIRNPKRVRPDLRAVKAVDLMEASGSKITVLPVVDDDDRVVGMIHLHQLIEAGLTS
ncbi:MAG: KpsF/GutQ family sugar-phosphate isomerase [Sumerlaeia bacterium]